MHFLQDVHRDYSGFGVLDKDVRSSNRMNGKRGVALMWHRALVNNISILDIGSDRIRYRYNVNQFMLIIQVYAPCSRHPIFVFLSLLIINSPLYAGTGTVILMGDSFAGPIFLKPTYARGRYLQDMLNYHVLNISRHRPITCQLLWPTDINSQNSKFCTNMHIKWRNIDDHVPTWVHVRFG